MSLVFSVLVLMWQKKKTLTERMNYGTRGRRICLSLLFFFSCSLVLGRWSQLSLSDLKLMPGQHKNGIRGIRTQEWQILQKCQPCIQNNTLPNSTVMRSFSSSDLMKITHLPSHYCWTFFQLPVVPTPDLFCNWHFNWSGAMGRRKGRHETWANDTVCTVE